MCGVFTWGILWGILYSEECSFPMSGTGRGAVLSLEKLKDIRRNHLDEEAESDVRGWDSDQTSH